MKCGVITLFGINNYGNRLQNFAVEQLLLELGFDEATTYNIIVKENYILEKDKGIKRVIKQLLPTRIISLYDIVIEMLGDKLVAKRNRMFRKFNDNNINVKKIYVKNMEQLNNVPELQSNDFFVVGSDQVWNPRLGVINPQYFLQFVPTKKRVAISASVGIEKIDEPYIEKFKAGVLGMNYISVREESAKTLINEMTKREADVFLDPTFLIDRNKWINIMKKPEKKLPDNYILCLFLNKEPEESIAECKKITGKEIIYMNNVSASDFYDLGPSEFLYMVQNADMVLTDSFHVTVFSILFHKQFYVYHRKHSNPEYMFTRLRTLLGKFELTDRVQSREEFTLKQEISEQRYLDIDMLIREEKEKVEQILKTVFYS